MRIRIDDGDFKRMITVLRDIPEDVVDEAYDYFKGKTPVRTGNARRKTKLNKKTIHAEYPYAGRLDDGYSNQARDGMTDPTVDFIQAEINRRTGRV